MQVGLISKYRQAILIFMVKNDSGRFYYDSSRQNHGLRLID